MYVTPESRETFINRPRTDDRNTEGVVDAEAASEPAETCKIGRSRRRVSGGIDETKVRKK